MKSLLSLLLACYAMSLTAQNNTKYKYTEHQKHFSIQYFGWSFHPGGGAVNMIKNYPLKLDAKATIVLNIGISMHYDYDLSEKWFLRAEAGFLKDCAYTNSGYLHYGFRWKPIQLGRHSINGGIGLTLMAREDWHRFEGYQDSDIYGKNVWKGMQYRFIPFGGEIEYMYKINDRMDFNYSVIPGYPAVLASKFGFRWRI